MSFIVIKARLILNFRAFLNLINEDCELLALRATRFDAGFMSLVSNAFPYVLQYVSKINENGYLPLFSRDL